MKKRVVERILTRSGIKPAKKDYDIELNLVFTGQNRKDLSEYTPFSIVSLEGNPVLRRPDGKYTFSAIVIKEDEEWVGLGLHAEIEDKENIHGFYPSNKAYDTRSNTYKMLKRLFDKI